MKKSIHLLVLTLSFALHAKGQLLNKPFDSPLNIPLVLAGNFGELRTGHFHAGLDIKTQNREGLSVLAIEQGYVSRIKIALNGYGKAIYVTHPNGMTSVYAHLQRFAPNIQSYIQDLQYQKKTFVLEVFPDPEDFPIQRGETIAYSGNTGGSTAPHLHFELRDSASSDPQNPVLFDFNIDDHTPPVVQKLYAYPLDSSSVVNRSDDKIQIVINRDKEGNYLANPVRAKGAIGFSIKAFDRQDLAYNRNGIYKIEQLLANQSISQIRFNHFSFSDSNEIEAVMDYEHLVRFRETLMYLFKNEKADLSIYDHHINNGIIDMNTLEKDTLLVVLTDAAANSSRIIIPLIHDQSEATLKKEPLDSPIKVNPELKNRYLYQPWEIQFPKGCFQEPTKITIKEEEYAITISPFYRYLKKPITLSFDTEKINEAKIDKAYIALINQKGKQIYNKTVISNNKLTTSPSVLGKFAIAYDSIAPTIKEKNFKPGDQLNYYRQLVLTIEDAQTGIQSYEAYINDQWILMEYEPKDNSLSYFFDDRIAPANRYHLKVIATDMLNNKTEYNTVFSKMK